MSVLMAALPVSGADFWDRPLHPHLLPPVEICSDDLVYHNHVTDEPKLGRHDERFVRYDTSPGESISTCSDEDGHETYFSQQDVQDQQGQMQLVENFLKHPLSDKMDPFETLPTSLNHFQEHLLYSRFQSISNSSPPLDHRSADGAIITEPGVQMTTQAGLRITLAQSALNRLSYGKHQNEDVRKSLEGAVHRYRSDAITALQGTHQTTRQSHESEELLDSLLDLEKLEKKMGNLQPASTHLARIRDVLRSSGGPLSIQSARLSRSMVYFECLYGTSRQSYVWSELDFLQSLVHVNGFFSSVWMTWRSLTQQYSLVAHEMKSILGAGAMSASFPSFLQETSTMKACLSLSANGRPGISDIDRNELICQLTSLLILCTHIVDNQTEQVKLQQSLDKYHDMVEAVQLDHSPNERLMWLLQNDLAGNTPQRLWRAAEHTWLCKHVSYNVQCMIKDWLLKFLTGQPLERCFKLDAFYFSYAS